MNLYLPNETIKIMYENALMSACLPPMRCIQSKRLYKLFKIFLHIQYIYVFNACDYLCQGNMHIYMFYIVKNY